MKYLARALHCSEGHAYTAVIVAAILTVMIAAGLPPLLDDPEAVPAERAPPTTTTIAIPRFGEAPPTSVVR